MCLAGNQFQTPRSPEGGTKAHRFISDTTAQALADHDSIQSLASYLGISEQDEDDLHAVQDSRADGTCEWILEKESYTEWKDHQYSNAPPILWMNGKPATGKSVLAGFVIDDIGQSDTPCSYYFFKHGDVSKARLSACLRSLAFQMASVDPGIRSAFMKLQNDRLRVDPGNERNLWRALFSPAVLEKATVPHYWVIDALDECNNFAPLLDSMLTKVDSSTRLRVFITSRETPELCRLFAGLGPQRFRQGQVSAEETLPDIERIVTAKGGSFYTDSEESRAVLEKSIIEKSKGSFLWTLLVLDELSTAFSEEEIKRVLGEVPRGMEPLYHRALDTMALATRGKTLAKAILSWTTCVMRPLMLRELECALEIDLKDKFPRLGETIRTLCGQLVTVDATGRVQMVHETAREFLLDEGLDSEFAVCRSEAHTRIAKTCLEYLSGDELKPPRTERRGGSSRTMQAGGRSEFLTYSNATFSSHLAKADPSSDHVLGLVDKFLKLNVLTWIRNIAVARNLGLMIRAAEDLKAYANSCAVERSPLRRDIQGVRAWSVDLQRVAAKFADALIVSPSSIYSRVAPFCPAGSAIYATTTAPPGQRLSVAGLPAFQWDDRLSCLDFGGGETTALCYGNEFLAVGLRGGRIVLYHPSSAQEYRSLSHGETVMHLRFREQSDLLLSVGLKMIHVWNVRTGQQLHRLLSPRRCVALAFYDNLLVAASNQNVLHSWDLDDGAAEQVKRPWRDSADDDLPFLNRPPSAVSIAVTHRMMAVAYSCKPITIWDLEQDAYYGSCGKKLPSGETSTHPIVALLFNPNAAIELLAASYLDGELVIIDPFADREIEKQRVSCHTLAASPDGRLLAGGGAGGIIQIFEFDTLRLLYKVRSSDLFIKTLAFSPDGVSLADLRGSQCNIWMPPVLLAGASLDDTLSVDTASTAGESPPAGTKVRITALALVSNRGGILCGKADGSVSVYDGSSGDQIHTLYFHKDAVRTLYWLPSTNTVLSTCLSNGIHAWTLEMSKPQGQIRWAASTCVLDAHLLAGGRTIVRVLPGEGAGKFIVSTRQSDHLWSLHNGNEECVREDNDYDGSAARRWLQHPRSQSHAIRVEQEALHIHSWQDLSLVVSVSVGNHSLADLSIKGAFPCGALAGVLLDLTEANGSTGTRTVCVLGCNGLPSGVEGSTPIAMLSTGPGGGGDDSPTTQIPPLFLTRLGSDNIVGQIAHIIGICPRAAKTTKLAFLDTRSWVCSIDLVLNGAVVNLGSIKSYTRHFFVPYDWFAGTRRPIGGVTEQGDVVFAKNGDVAVIKGGLEYAEIVNLPSPAQLGTGKAGKSPMIR